MIPITVPGICVNFSQVRIEMFIQCGKITVDVFSYQLDQKLCKLWKHVGNPIQDLLPSLVLAKFLFHRMEHCNSIYISLSLSDNDYFFCLMIYVIHTLLTATGCTPPVVATQWHSTNGARWL